MVKFITISWLRHYLKNLQRNLLFYLNLVFCLFVWQISFYDEDKAAVLSYIAVATTVLTIKSTFKRIGNTYTASIFCLNVLSNTMIVSGICTALFFQYWHTALYSICLGLLIQKMKYDMELRYPDLDLAAQVSEEDSLSDTSDELVILDHQNAITHNPKVISFEEDVNDSVQQIEQNKNLMHEVNKEIDGFVEQNEFAPKFCGDESKTGVNFLFIKGKRKAAVNTQEIKTKFPKIELDAANIKPNQNVGGDLSEEFIKLNEKDLKPFDTINSEIKLASVSESKIENKFSHAQVDIAHTHQNDSQDLQKNDFLNSLQYQNLHQRNQNENKGTFHLDSENPLTDSAYLKFLNNVNSKYLLGQVPSDVNKIDLPNKTCDKISNAAIVTDLGKSLIKETISSKNNADESNHSVCTKTVHFENEKETCNYQMSDISEQVNVIDTCSSEIAKVNVLRESLESENHKCKTASNSCMTLEPEIVTLERNEIDNDKMGNEESEDEDFNLDCFKSVSDIEGVVNRIDMSFIYSLGFNMPSATD